MRPVQVAFVVVKAETVASYGIMYLSSVLKAAGHCVELWSVEDGRELCRRLEEGVPDVLAYGVTTGLHRVYLEMNRLAKSRFDFLSLFGGPHPTFFPEMVEEDGVDVVCRGEGEEAIVDFCSRLAEGRSIKDTPNFWLKCEEGIVRNPVRPLIADLDSLPHPDWDLYFSWNHSLRKHNVKSFLASRGCPHRCSYCFNDSLLDLYKGGGKYVRWRSVDSVLDEIKEVRRRYPMTLVWFLDSNFLFNRAWLEEFAERYPREIGLPFYCKIRADVSDDAVIHLLAKAGCSGVGLGIETADEEFRERVMNRRMSNERIIETCRLLRAYDINIMSFNLVGLPGERAEDAWRTVELNIACNVDYAMTMVLQPYPGTKMAEYCIREGHFDGDFESLDYNYYSHSVLNAHDPVNKRRIENLQRLFAIAVEFPFLKRVIRRGLDMNLRSFYCELFTRWHGHCFSNRFYKARRPADREKGL